MLIFYPVNRNKSSWSSDMAETGTPDQKRSVGSNLADGQGLKRKKETAGALERVVGEREEEKERERGKKIRILFC